MATQADIEAGLAQARERSGAPSDPTSDRIWAERIASGEATFSNARSRIITEKGGQTGTQNYDYVQRYAPGTAMEYPDGPVAGGDGGRTPDDLAPPSGGQPDTFVPRNPGDIAAPEVLPPPTAPTEPEPSAPERQLDYRSYAPPWMTGPLLDAFVDQWAQTGDANLAMAAVRRSSAYDSYFVGNRREDGSLRYDENTYLATRDAFRETMNEFGLGTTTKGQMESLFVNDVDAQEFYQGIGSAYQAFTEPGSDVPAALMQEFLRGFTSTGSAEAGWSAARGSNAYNDIFAGNIREDGSLRMEEQNYYAYKRGWQRTLVSFGLNPTEFESRGRFLSAVTGEVSVEELNGRLQFVQDGIIDRIPAYMDFYSTNYGIDLTPEAILGMAIDPSIQTDVLERRVQAGQIGGEAAVRGFSLRLDRAEQLARHGVTSEQARQLYGQAEANLPGLSATTSRYNRGVTTLTDFEDATALGDVAGQRRLEGALSEEASQFTERSDTRRSQDGFGLAGLQQR